jgi:hypothetical protein
MAATVRGAIRELLEQTMVTIDALLETYDRELAMPSSRAANGSCSHFAPTTPGNSAKQEQEPRIKSSPRNQRPAHGLASEG